MQNLIKSCMKLIKSFCRGPGGGFFKKSSLAAGGKGVKITGSPLAFKLNIRYNYVLKHNVGEHNVREQGKRISRVKPGI
jgi:hypothetical protein